ncbi:hypothetical protein J3E68DRAFT_311257 [Trichoderma sp. SZMC 28012]
MAPPAGYEKPPQFEISDLKLQSSDPMWPEAVRLVQTYWKQATVLAPEQRRQYLEYFDRPNLASMLGSLKRLNIVGWWDKLRDKNGNLLFKRLAWPWYMKISTLHGTLPEDYKAAIKTVHGRSVIEDFTESYRLIYPAPKETDAIIKAASTSQPADSISIQKDISNLAPSSNQQQNATPMQIKANGISVTASQEQDATSPQKNNIVISVFGSIQQQNPAAKKKKGGETQVSTDQKETHTPPQNKAVTPSPSFTEQQNATPTQEKANTLTASTIQQDNNSSAGTQLPPTSPKTTQLVESEAWNISNVVDVLGHVRKKRLSSAPESSPKRVKANEDDLSNPLNLRITITQKSLDQLRSNVEDQGSKLQGVSVTAEQNKQILNDMQSELRQFMSAVASTLQDIQERLEE